MHGGRSMPQHPPRAALGRAVALAMALALALGACSADNPAPKPLASSTPTVSPTASTSATPSGPPPLPAAARGTSKAAAVAFVRHWIDTLNYSAATLDDASLARLNDRACEPCGVFIDRIRQVRRGGGHIDGLHWKIDDARALNTAGPSIEVQGVVVLSPSRVFLTPSGKPQRFTGGRSFYTFSTQHSGGRWVISDIQRAAS